MPRIACALALAAGMITWISQTTADSTSEIKLHFTEAPTRSDQAVPNQEIPAVLLRLLPSRSPSDEPASKSAALATAEDKTKKSDNKTPGIIRSQPEATTQRNAGPAWNSVRSATDPPSSEESFPETTVVTLGVEPEDKIPETEIAPSRRVEKIANIVSDLPTIPGTGFSQSADAADIRLTANLMLQEAALPAVVPAPREIVPQPPGPPAYAPTITAEPQNVSPVISQDYGCIDGCGRGHRCGGRGKHTICYKDAPPGWYLHNALQIQISRGIADQMVLYHYDFLEGHDSAQLSRRGKWQLQKFASAIASHGYPVIIQPSYDASGLDTARRAQVLAELQTFVPDVTEESVLIAKPHAVGLRGVEALSIDNNNLLQTQSRGTLTPGLNFGTTSGTESSGSFFGTE